MNVTIQDVRNKSINFDKIERGQSFYFDYLGKYYLYVKIDDKQAYCLSKNKLLTMNNHDEVQPVTVELNIIVK